MANKKHRWVALVAAVLIAFGTFPMTASADTDPLPNLEDNGKMWYQMGIGNAFNIQGYVGSTLYRTTYGDAGYSVRLFDETTYYNLTNVSNGVENTYGNLGLTMKLAFVSSGYYVKVQYIVRNLSDQTQTFSIGTCSDTMIGGNDYAPLEIVDNSTLVMRDGATAQFNIVGRNAYGVTDVSTFWMGGYGSRFDNLLNDGPTSLVGVDSGLAYSWKDKVLLPGATTTLSVLFGVGPVNYAPEVSLDTTPSQVELSDNMTLAGTVSDSENTTGTKLYYVLDSGEPVLFHTFTEAPGAFSYSLDLPETTDFLGEHKVIVFAEDTDGAISQSTERTFSVVMPPITGIAVVTLPDNLTYQIGDQLDLSGLTIKLVYDNDMSKPVEDFTVSVPNGQLLNQAGEFKVIVSYTVDNVTYQAEFPYIVEAAEAPLEPEVVDTGDDNPNGVLAFISFLAILGMGASVYRRKATQI
jgi:voltage-gated potassium channel Kch